MWQIENVYVDNVLAENMETARIMLILVGRERLRIASETAKKRLIDNDISMSIYGKNVRYMVYYIHIVFINN